METGDEAAQPCWVDLLDDRLLGQVFQLAGKDQRQCQAVCRRWRRVWFSEPGLWRDLHLSPATDVDVQLAVLQRVAPLVERLEIKGAAGFEAALQQQGAAHWSLPAVLARFPAGERQRLRQVQLSTDLLRLRPEPYFRSWTLVDHQPLSAAALRKLGRLRGLRALELDSWQLPHCTAEVLCRLTQLSRLRLRARDLPPGCLPGVITEQMTQLCSLVLETSVACSPAGISQLTALSALTRLEVRQSNPVDHILFAPDGGWLPHLSAMRFHNERGMVLLRGGHQVSHVHVLRSDQQAALAVHHYDMRAGADPQPSLARLLSSLVPPATTLDRLQACVLTYDSTAVLQGCSQLRTLRSLAINGMFTSQDSRAAGLLALLDQIRELTELRLNFCYDEDDGGWSLLSRVLHGQTALRKLSLANNELRHACTAPFLLRMENLDLTNCRLQRFPAGAALSAPLLRTLCLAGNCDMVLTDDDIDTLEMVSFLQVLDLRGVQIRPEDVASLPGALPGVQLILDSAADAWDPDYHPPVGVLGDLEAEPDDWWQAVEEGR